MAIDRELYIRDEITTHIGTRGLTTQREAGAGVWLLSRRTEAQFVKLSEFYEVFEDQRKVDKVKCVVSHADLSRQVVAIWMVADVLTVSNLHVVDIA